MCEDSSRFLFIGKFKCEKEKEEFFRLIQTGLFLDRLHKQISYVEYASNVNKWRHFPLQANRILFTNSILSGMGMKKKKIESEIKAIKIDWPFYVFFLNIEIGVKNKTRSF